MFTVVSCNVLFDYDPERTSFESRILLISNLMYNYVYINAILYSFEPLYIYDLLIIL